MEMDYNKITDFLLKNITSEAHYLQMRLNIDGNPDYISMRNTIAARALKIMQQRVLEFYWSITTMLGYGYLHDGTPRPLDFSPSASRPPESGQSCPNLPQGQDQPRILIDVTETYRSGANTGIQRISRKAAEFAVASGQGVPFVFDGKQLRHFYKGDWPPVIDVREGDILLFSDIPSRINIDPLVEIVRAKNGKVVFVNCDIIPLIFPSCFISGFSTEFEIIVNKLIENADAVVTISHATAADLSNYIKNTKLFCGKQIRIGWWHLGADFADLSETAVSTHGPVIADDAPYFLGVGTLEPRKAWGVAIDAMEQLWASGVNAKFVLVGRYGWSCLALADRITRHREFGKRLIWLKDAGDIQLAQLYKNALAVVYPSIYEGFGLPVIEARHFGSPVIASDIPVFREIAGDSILYFRQLDADDLAEKMRSALRQPPQPPDFPTLDWAQSMEQLLNLVRDLVQDDPRSPRGADGLFEAAAVLEARPGG